MNKPRLPYGPLLVASSAALLFFRCSIVPLSGGGTEGGNVSGLFVNDDGTASAMVRVLLVPADYNAGAVNQNKPIPSTFTGTDGSYSFGLVPKGSYSVEAFNPASGKRSLITGITVADKDVRVPIDSLRNPGTIKIFLQGTANTATGYFFVPGTTIYSAIGGANGFITIKSVPAATLPPICYSETGLSSSDVIRYGVAVPSGDTAVVANPGWKYARRIYLNTSAAGAGVSSTVTKFPVLVRLTSGTFNFSEANSDGSDIRFIKLDTIFLHYEKERWDAASQRAEIWVAVDTIYGNNDTQSITMYWGNDSALATSNGTEVFDTGNGFAGVWHMNENPAAGANAIKDRTSNYHNATQYGSMNAAAVVDGAIGKALDFDGSNDYCDAGRVALAGSYSVGLWVKVNRINDYQRFVFQDSGFTLWYDSDRSGARMEHIDSSGIWRGIPQDGGAVQPMSTGAWYYLTGTYDGDKVKLYLNGELVTTTNSFGVHPRSHGFHLLFGEAWNTGYVNGIMDEIRVEKTARSADWIRLCYMNQRVDDQLVNSNK